MRYAISWDGTFKDRKSRRAENTSTIFSVKNLDLVKGIYQSPDSVQPFALADTTETAPLSKKIQKRLPQKIEEITETGLIFEKV